jgi:polar amino acid transport system substrate-binding protein
MKKLIALALSVVLALGAFAGCGGKEATTAKVIEIDLTSEEYAFGVDKTQPELLASVNAFIAEIQSNGKFEEICNNYFGDGTPVAVSSAAYDASKDQLVVATNAEFPPYEFREGDKITGLDVDMMLAVCDILGMELKIEDMQFDSIIASVISGKADVGVAGLTVTEDRLKSVDFSDTYYTGKQVIIVTE